jgi:beta-galactosidase
MKPIHTTERLYSEMYRKRLYLIILTFTISLGLLVLNWNTSLGVLLESSSYYTSAGRWEMDLSGQWRIYPSLRQAWVTETEQDGKGIDSPITGGKFGYLPSNKEFHVAARTFKEFTVNARSILMEWRALSKLEVLSVRVEVDGCRFPLPP